jgi:hypothetical protein
MCASASATVKSPTAPASSSMSASSYSVSALALCLAVHSTAFTLSSSTTARPSASTVALHPVLATVLQTATCSSAPSGAPSMACSSALAMVLPTLARLDSLDVVCSRHRPTVVLLESGSRENTTPTASSSSSVSTSDQLEHQPLHQEQRRQLPPTCSPCVRLIVSATKSTCYGL